MSHHIRNPFLFHSPQFLPNLFRSAHSSHRNLFEWHLRKMNKAAWSLSWLIRGCGCLGSHQATPWPRGSIAQHFSDPSAAHRWAKGWGAQLSVLLYYLLNLPSSEKRIEMFYFNVDSCFPFRICPFSSHVLKQDC